MNFSRRPNRAPIWKSIDRIRLHWLAWLVLGDGVYALLTIFGESAGAPQQLLRSVLPFATPLWGGALLMASVLLALGYLETGGSVGAACWLALTAAAVGTVQNGTALSTAAWVLPAWAAGWHLLVLYEATSGLDALRESQQRRE